MSASLPTIALEEHFVTPAILEHSVRVRGAIPLDPALLDLGEQRLAAMDAAGIDVAVLSVTAPGIEHVPARDSAALARDANDVLLDAVGRHPQRFAGFAALPVADPGAAASELTRCVESGLRGALVNGTVAGRFLDHPDFADVLAVAADLQVPLYLHPGFPPRAVVEAYYAGFSTAVTRMLATAAWGWHADTATHVLRMVLSGALDRHPGLQLVIGHMGEMLPVMLDRIDQQLSPVAGLQRRVGEYFTGNVNVTLAGFYSVPAFQAAVQGFGIDRMMFSTDYPYGPGDAARRFLETVPLSPEDRRRLAGGNAARLLRIPLADTAPPPAAAVTAR